jgi:DNA-directed RNA polymerase subunit RPC12/RpoP
MTLSLEKIAKTFLALTCLFAVCYVIYNLTDSEPDQRNHKVCPDCGLEYPPQALETQECPYCKIKNGGQAVKPRTLRVVGSPFELERMRRNKGLMAALGVIGLCVLMLGTHYFIKNWMAPREDPYFSFKCFYCKRKLKYKLKQIGHTGLCPGCHNRFKFPSREEVAKREKAEEQ